MIHPCRNHWILNQGVGADNMNRLDEPIFAHLGKRLPHHL